MLGAIVFNCKIPMQVLFQIKQRSGSVVECMPRD